MRLPEINIALNHYLSTFSIKWLLKKRTRKVQRKLQTNTIIRSSEKQHSLDIEALEVFQAIQNIQILLERVLLIEKPYPVISKMQTLQAD